MFIKLCKYMLYRKLFESIPLANEPKIFESVRNYYKSCMDQV